MEPKLISPEKFFKLYGYKPVDLLKNGLYTADDLKELAELESKFKQSAFDLDKVLKFVFFAVKNPNFVADFLIPRILNSKRRGRESLKSNSTVVNGNMKANLINVFHPKKILEIGTYLGWGAGAFKYINPKAKVFTINPKQDNVSNNPIKDRYVGIFFKNKKLKVNQLWGDSLKYNFRKVAPVDVSYVDGNHNYDYVLSDIEKCSKISRKAVVLDDYLPIKYASKHKIVYGPWNESVVKAVRDFLKTNSHVFKKAYLIEGYPYCVLVK